MQRPVENAVAIRATVRGDVQGVGFRVATVRRAHALHIMGWVRNGQDGSVQVHAEGEPEAVQAMTAFLSQGPRGARVADVEVGSVAVEGHEQFAIRGVSAGGFVVRERAERGRFELGLEVQGRMRWWELPKGPSMDPAVRRMAIEAGASLGGASLGGAGSGGAGAAGAGSASAGEDAAVVWDSGPYEQGGRVAWPEALERGHAVFVLHGRRLRGGFALQRTRPGAAQWLLIKRRDDEARPGSDVTAEQTG